MREIKFRAWCSIADGYRENRMDYDVILKDGKYADVEAGWDIHGVSDTIKIMQYTGMKDKNGKEIYERDIVKIAYGIKKPYKEIISEVIYDDGYEVDIGRLASFHNVCEVIGNIYENPELLEKIGGEYGKV